MAAVWKGLRICVTRGARNSEVACRQLYEMFSRN
jgi:hypothetical protein